MDIFAAIGALPEHWQQYAVTALTVVGLVSTFLVVSKPVIDRVVPAEWRPWVDGLFRILEAVALNTRPLHERAKERVK